MIHFTIFSWVPKVQLFDSKKLDKLKMNYIPNKTSKSPYSKHAPMHKRLPKGPKNFQHSPILSLKIVTHASKPGQPLTTPSLFTFKQLVARNCQIMSLKATTWPYLGWY